VAGSAWLHGSPDPPGPLDTDHSFSALGVAGKDFYSVVDQWRNVIEKLTA